MSCTKHFLNLRWERHAWVRQVSFEEHVSSHEADMWGRVVSSEHVRCHTREVCSECGQTRGGSECLCDTSRADRCTIRCDFLASRQSKTA